MTQQKPFWKDWEIQQKLGSGSYGAVYRICRQLPGGLEPETAALKVISIPRDNKDIQDLVDRNFDEEAITAHFAGQLQDILKEYAIMKDLKGHTNIVYCDDVHCVPHEDGIGWNIYIKMELLTPLRSVLRPEYREGDVVKLGMDIASALAHCHRSGVIHRDVKPQNILVSRSGEFKLGDFGTAKYSEGTAAATMTGTYEYMAPEVFRRQKYNATADIYSLGIVMYHLMNQRHLPFVPVSRGIPTATQVETAFQRRLRGEPIPEPMNGSPELKRIVLKACAYDPKERYASADALRRELSLLANREIPEAAGEAARIFVPADMEERTVLAEERTVLDREEATLLELGEATVLDLPPEQKAKKKPLIPLLLGLAAAAAGCAVLLLGGGKVRETVPQTSVPVTVMATVPAQTIPETTQTPETEPQPLPPETEPVEDLRWRNNVLKADVVGTSQSMVYNSGVRKAQILSVTFLDTLASAPRSAWDVSESKDGSVMAWVNGDGQNYDLFIGAEGGINGAASAKNLLRDYSNLRSVRFQGNYRTDLAESICGMFAGCRSLTEVDPENLNVSGVADFTQVFLNCENLTQLDLSGWDVSSAQTMDEMFRGCKLLKDIAFGPWESGKVTGMQMMFYGCEALEYADLSAFETDSVESMLSMFEGCTALTGADLSSFRTDKLISVAKMFLSCPKLQDLDFSNLDVSNVEAHYYFMDAGKTVNGQPWENLFS